MSESQPLSITLERVVGRYGSHLGVGPVSGDLTGPGRVWITGSNGSGKSTLLRLIAGMMRPASGSVGWRLGGRNLTASQLRSFRTLSAPEIQLYEELSSLENLEFIASLRGFARPTDLAVRVLTDAGLLDRAHDHPHALSSGLRQRLKLSLTWMGNPPLVLLDEPSSNLDENARSWLWQRVAVLARTSLCLISTNQLEEVSAEDLHLRLQPTAAA